MTAILSAPSPSSACPCASLSPLPESRTVSLRGIGFTLSGLSADSRAVPAGGLFVAIPGVRQDGRAFIPAAVAAGATAVLAPEGTVWPAGSEHVLRLESPNVRQDFARLAAAFYSRQPERIVAVTGTNGKTSVVQFVRQIWNRLGRDAAALGTVGRIASRADGREEAHYGAMTTPDPVMLHQDLRALAEAGFGHVALEASSHGLDQYRLDGVSLSAAAFTNLTRDHLDYHQTMDNYRAAKAGLFTRVLPAGATAVLNADSPEFPALASLCQARGLRLWSYGENAGAHLRLVERQAGMEGQELVLDVFGVRHRVRLPLAGAFQAANALAALGLVLAGVGEEQVAAAVAALETLHGAKGRLERVAVHPCGAPVYVDYAHTPDALETVLTALRPHVGNQLWVVFGCGGDRDPGKRPLMGGIAARLADQVRVTDDNPRTEAAALIRRQVLEGCAAAGGEARIEEIGDRRAAIMAAVAGLQKGDLLVIAGKGHEPGQIIGTEVLPFDDSEAARAAVAAVSRGPNAGEDRA